MQCATCHSDLKEGASFCGNCGAAILLSPAQPQYATAPAAATPAPGAAPLYAVPKQPSSGFSIASLVLGILSLVCSLIWFISIPLGVAALVFGFMGKPKGGKGMALAGIITGAIGIVASIIIVIVALQYLENIPDQQTRYNSLTPANSVAQLKSYSLSAAAKAQ